ncbi:MAG: chromosome segregation protein SMC [Firmicutes bacterium]|nr:chromosome segregation protein SMC [Bacillota bacterium]
MRLKRLEIQGFKSFARPVCLDFGPGITAIVGPNGSGKSNISDALRWVMGEQSAKSLRGQKMEDVIFAGSEGKKALGMAEVQLTLDNSTGFFPLDYAEVTVSRRVYRSGESEFYINKQNCRLRDIHDLFTDTGLGREGYSIIGQGQIDSVLSVRSEDRRVLLEETAGIVKYRQRKEQALRKLDETSVDLLRVTDILHELQSQLGPLSEQAEQAKLYLGLADRLQGAELDYYSLSWRGIDAKFVQSEEMLKKLRDEYEAHQEGLAQTAAKQEHLTEAMAKLEANIEEHQAELNRLNEEYNQGLHRIELYEERIRNHEARSEQLTGLLRAKEEELKLFAHEDGGLAQEIETLQEQIRVQEDAIRQHQLHLEELQQSQRHAQSKVNQLKDDFFEFMRELADKRNFQRGFAERKQNLLAQIAASEKELTSLADSRLVSDEVIRTYQLRYKELGERLEQQEAQEVEILEKLEAMKPSLVEVQQELRRKEGELAQVRSRLKTLQELEEGYEGYAFGVRRIMQHAEMSRLVLGTVADVVTVPQGLETAYEVALGSSLQNLLTTGEEDAKRIIHWLRKVQGGRVTILPLDAVRGVEFSRESKRLLEQEGVLGTGLDLLTFGEQYRPAIASLLGRVVITEDLDVALALKRRLRQFSRIVTRDGSVVFPSGAMTGGSINSRTSGLLARKGQLLQLEEEAVQLGAEVKAKAEQVARLTESIAQSEEELSGLRNAGVETRFAAQKVEQDLHHALEQQENRRRLIQELEGKRQDVEVLLENLAAEGEVAAAGVLALEQEEVLRREQIREQETALAELAEALEESSLKQTEKHVELAELKGSLENQRILLANLEQKKLSARREQKAAQEELQSLALARSENEEQIVRTQAANESNRRQKGEVQRILDEEKQVRLELQKELAALGAERIQVEKEQLKRERALYKSEVEQEQLEREREQILSVLAEQNVTLESILQRDVTAKESTLKRTIAELRNEIKELGLVNPGATQEYERVLERCSFLEIQLQDLNEAREGLQDVINEMDKLCRTKLWDVFRKVQVEFETIFSQLFLGGRAELVLTDPESILTTGIDIMARPPGKKLQNLLLLSGGERALTAIALLFAIRKVQPTPFWVLDEIDAALDESNLGRFVELMEEFAEETQFLVVTHRPRTMEAADTLYGVTMGDDGFSQIISVALN